jgi:hypothetical protein
MKSETTRKHATFLTLLGIILVGGGCGGGDEGPAIYPVSGKILVDGKPAAKALVTFHPASGSPGKAIPFAETDAEGTFRPSSRMSHDGAPAGDYILTILWPEVRVDHGEEVSGPDRLGGRYGNPRGSGLKVTIKEGENSLPPFDLKSSR